MKTIQIIVGLLVVAGIVLIATQGGGNDAQEQKEGLVELAQCLEENGAKFYGAFWCPHCQDQHRLFGRKGSDELPYIECSTPDGNNQTEVCKEAEISSYPTWRFADGSELGGTQGVEALAEAAGCPLPESLSEAEEPEVDGDATEAVSEMESEEDEHEDTMNETGMES